MCGGLSTLLAIGSPFVLFFAVRAGRVEEGALVLLAYALLRALPAVLAAERSQLLAALRLPLVAIAGATVGVVTHEARVLLVLPSASQAAFAAVFLSSLRGVPLVEHFARMKVAKLTWRHVRYCRTVTLVWGVILLTASLLGLLLAFVAPLGVWAAFSTVGSYALVALVFSTEYVVRKIRFREYGAFPVDRLLRVFYPPPPAPVTALDLSQAREGHVDVVLPPDYVFFRGHFDGAPILPGIVQLTELCVPLVRRLAPGVGALRGLDRVRFRRPIHPGERVSVDVRPEPAEAGSVDAVFGFELRVGAATAASGLLRFASRP